MAMSLLRIFLLFLWLFFCLVVYAMTTTVQFPLTNQELYDLAQGELVRFPASREEYWELLEAAEYRADYCDHAVFNPDGSVVAQPARLYEYRPGMNAELTPVLVFEVLSKSTRVYDFGDKLPCYKTIPSLRYILYLESRRPEVTVFERLPDTGQWLETNLRHLDDVFQIEGQSVALRDIYGAEVMEEG